MTRAGRYSLVALAAVALAWAASAADPAAIWVSSDGGKHAVHGDARMVLIEDGEGLDLSDLADGETRVLGSGDSAVTVSRSGDVATITRDASGGHERIEVRCELDRDTCKVITSEDDPERVMIVVRKERECVNGEGDCDESVWVDDVTGPDRILIRKVVHCDDAGECTETADTTAGPHNVFVESLKGGAPEGHVMFVGGEPGGARSEVIVVERGAGALLRCPEGDATLSVKKDELEQVFLCPKHSVPLERVEPRDGLHRIRVKHAAESH